MSFFPNQNKPFPDKNSQIISQNTIQTQKNINSINQTLPEYQQQQNYSQSNNNNMRNSANNFYQQNENNYSDQEQDIPQNQQYIQSEPQQNISTFGFSNPQHQNPESQDNQYQYQQQQQQQQMNKALLNQLQQSQQSQQQQNMNRSMVNINNNQQEFTPEKNLSFFNYNRSQQNFSKQTQSSQMKKQPKFRAKSAKSQRPLSQSCSRIQQSSQQKDTVYIKLTSEQLKSLPKNLKTGTQIIQISPDRNKNDELEEDQQQQEGDVGTTPFLQENISRNSAQTQKLHNIVNAQQKQHDIQEYQNFIMDQQQQQKTDYVKMLQYYNNKSEKPKQNYMMEDQNLNNNNNQSLPYIKSFLPGINTSQQFINNDHRALSQTSIKKSEISSSQQQQQQQQQLQQQQQHQQQQEIPQRMSRPLSAYAGSHRIKRSHSENKWQNLQNNMNNSTHLKNYTNFSNFTQNQNNISTSSRISTQNQQNPAKFQFSQEYLQYQQQETEEQEDNVKNLYKLIQQYMKEKMSFKKNAILKEIMHFFQLIEEKITNYTEQLQQTIEQTLPKKRDQVTWQSVEKLNQTLQKSEQETKQIKQISENFLNNVDKSDQFFLLAKLSMKTKKLLSHYKYMKLTDQINSTLLNYFTDPKNSSFHKKIEDLINQCIKKVKLICGQNDTQFFENYHQKLEIFLENVKKEGQQLANAFKQYHQIQEQIIPLLSPPQTRSSSKTPNSPPLNDFDQLLKKVQNTHQNLEELNTSIYIQPSILKESIKNQQKLKELEQQIQEKYNEKIEEFFQQIKEDIDFNLDFFNPLEILQKYLITMRNCQLYNEKLTEIYESMTQLCEKDFISFQKTIKNKPIHLQNQQQQQQNIEKSHQFLTLETLKLSIDTYSKSIQRLWSHFSKEKLEKFNKDHQKILSQIENLEELQQNLQENPIYKLNIFQDKRVGLNLEHQIQELLETQTILESLQQSLQKSYLDSPSLIILNLEIQLPYPIYHELPIILQILQNLSLKESLEKSKKPQKSTISKLKKLQTLLKLHEKLLQLEPETKHRIIKNLLDNILSVLFALRLNINQIKSIKAQILQKFKKKHSILQQNIDLYIQNDSKSPEKSQNSPQLLEKILQEKLKYLKEAKNLLSKHSYEFQDLETHLNPIQNLHQALHLFTHIFEDQNYDYLPDQNQIYQLLNQFYKQKFTQNTQNNENQQHFRQNLSQFAENLLKIANNFGEISHNFLQNQAEKIAQTFKDFANYFENFQKLKKQKQTEDCEFLSTLEKLLRLNAENYIALLDQPEKESKILKKEQQQLQEQEQQEQEQEDSSDFYENQGKNIVFLQPFSGPQTLQQLKNQLLQNQYFGSSSESRKEQGSHRSSIAQSEYSETNSTTEQFSAHNNYQQQLEQNDLKFDLLHHLLLEQTEIIEISQKEEEQQQQQLSRDSIFDRKEGDDNENEENFFEDYDKKNQKQSRSPQKYFNPSLQKYQGPILFQIRPIPEKYLLKIDISHPNDSLKTTQFPYKNVLNLLNLSTKDIKEHEFSSDLKQIELEIPSENKPYLELVFRTLSTQHKQKRNIKQHKLTLSPFKQNAQINQNFTQITLNLLQKQFNFCRGESLNLSLSNISNTQLYYTTNTHTNNNNKLHQLASQMLPSFKLEDQELLFFQKRKNLGQNTTFYLHLPQFLSQECPIGVSLSSDNYYYQNYNISLKKILSTLISLKNESENQKKQEKQLEEKKQKLQKIDEYKQEKLNFIQNSLKIAQNKAKLQQNTNQQLNQKQNEIRKKCDLKPQKASLFSFFKDSFGRIKQNLKENNQNFAKKLKKPNTDPLENLKRVQKKLEIQTEQEHNLQLQTTSISPLSDKSLLNLSNLENSNQNPQELLENHQKTIQESEKSLENLKKKLEEKKKEMENIQNLDENYLEIENLQLQKEKELQLIIQNVLSLQSQITEINQNYQQFLSACLYENSLNNITLQHQQKEKEPEHPPILNQQYQYQQQQQEQQQQNEFLYDQNSFMDSRTDIFSQQNQLSYIYSTSLKKKGTKTLTDFELTSMKKQQKTLNFNSQNVQSQPNFYSPEKRLQTDYNIEEQEEEGFVGGGEKLTEESLKKLQNKGDFEPIFFRELSLAEQKQKLSALRKQQGANSFIQDFDHYSCLFSQAQKAPKFFQKQDQNQEQDFNDDDDAISQATVEQDIKKLNISPQKPQQQVQQEKEVEVEQNPQKNVQFLHEQVSNLREEKQTIQQELQECKQQSYIQQAFSKNIEKYENLQKPLPLIPQQNNNNNHNNNKDEQQYTEKQQEIINMIQNEQNQEQNYLEKEYFKELQQREKELKVQLEYLEIQESNLKKQIEATHNNIQKSNKKQNQDDKIHVINNDKNPDLLLEDLLKQQENEEKQNILQQNEQMQQEIERQVQQKLETYDQILSQQQKENQELLQQQRQQQQEYQQKIQQQEKLLTEQKIQQIISEKKLQEQLQSELKKQISKQQPLSHKSSQQSFPHKEQQQQQQKKEEEQEQNQQKIEQISPQKKRTMQRSRSNISLKLKQDPKENKERDGFWHQKPQIQHEKPQQQQENPEDFQTPVKNNNNIVSSPREDVDVEVLQVKQESQKKLIEVYLQSQKKEKKEALEQQKSLKKQELTQGQQQLKKELIADSRREIWANFQKSYKKYQKKQQKKKKYLQKQELFEFFGDAKETLKKSTTESLEYIQFHLKNFFQKVQIQTTKKNLKQDLENGKNCLENKQYKNAHEIFKRVAQAYPKQTHVHLNLAKAAYYIEDYKQVKTSLFIVLKDERAMKEYKLWHKYATALYKLQKFQRSLKAFRLCIVTELKKNGYVRNRFAFQKIRVIRIILKFVENLKTSIKKGQMEQQEEVSCEEKVAKQYIQYWNNKGIKNLEILKKNRKQISMYLSPLKRLNSQKKKQQQQQQINNNSNVSISQFHLSSLKKLDQLHQSQLQQLEQSYEKLEQELEEEFIKEETQQKEKIEADIQQQIQDQQKQRQLQLEEQRRLLQQKEKEQEEIKEQEQELEPERVFRPKASTFSSPEKPKTNKNQEFTQQILSEKQENLLNQSQQLDKNQENLQQSVQTIKSQQQQQQQQEQQQQSQQEEKEEENTGKLEENQGIIPIEEQNQLIQSQITQQQQDEKEEEIDQEQQELEQNISRLNEENEQIIQQIQIQKSNLHQQDNIDLSNNNNNNENEEQLADRIREKMHFQAQIQSIKQEIEQLDTLLKHSQSLRESEKKDHAQSHQQVEQSLLLQQQQVKQQHTEQKQFLNNFQQIEKQTQQKKENLQSLLKQILRENQQKEEQKLQIQLHLQQEQQKLSEIQQKVAQIKLQENLLHQQLQNIQKQQQSEQKFADLQQKQQELQQQLQIQQKEKQAKKEKILKWKTDLQNWQKQRNEELQQQLEENKKITSEKQSLEQELASLKEKILNHQKQSKEKQNELKNHQKDKLIQEKLSLLKTEQSKLENQQLLFGKIKNLEEKAYEQKKLHLEERESLIKELKEQEQNLQNLRSEEVQLQEQIENLSSLKQRKAEKLLQKQENLEKRKEKLELFQKERQELLGKNLEEQKNLTEQKEKSEKLRSLQAKQLIKQQQIQKTSIQNARNQTKNLKQKTKISVKHQNYSQKPELSQDLQYYFEKEYYNDVKSLNNTLLNQENTTHDIPNKSYYQNLMQNLGDEDISEDIFNGNKIWKLFTIKEDAQQPYDIEIHNEIYNFQEFQIIQPQSKLHEQE